MRSREQGLTVFTAVLWLVGVLVIIQLWILAGSMEALLSGQTGVLLPATLVSLALLGLNGGLLRYVLRGDRRLRRRVGPME